jgi:hypothetical protein
MSLICRAERWKRLRAEWTVGDVVKHFFDYILKGKKPADSPA